MCKSGFGKHEHEIERVLDQIIGLAEGSDELLKKEDEADLWEDKAKDTLYFSQTKQTKRAKKFEKAISKYYKKVGKEISKRINKQLKKSFFFRASKDDYFTADQWEKIINEVFDKKEFAGILNQYTKEEVFLAYEETGENFVKVHEVWDDKGKPIVVDTNGDTITLAAQELERYEFELSDITNSKVDARLKGMISNALENGESIDTVEKKMRKEFDKLSKWKARQIARTEIVRASVKGNVGAYVDLGVSEFELQTSMRACPDCIAQSEKGPFPINEIESKIAMPPIHPNCRCAILPVL